MIHSLMGLQAIWNYTNLYCLVLPSNSTTAVGKSFEVCVSAIDHTDETNCDRYYTEKSTWDNIIYVAVPSFAMTDFVDNNIDNNTGNSFI